MKNFSEALEDLQAGLRISRNGWNGKGQYVFLVDQTDQDKNEEEDVTVPFLCINTVDDNRVPWLPSQTDILAEDWDIVK